MMEHLEPESLSAYLDGELEPRERSRVEEHLHACTECSAVRNKLASVTGQLAALPPVRVTVDEHRTLRQAVLDARPAGSRAGGLGWMQWALAGGLVIAAVAVFSVSFFGNRGAEQGGEALTEAAAPSAAAFDFTDRNQVDETVAALPEVLAGLGRYRAEDARTSAARNSAKGPGQPAPMARSDTPSDGDQFSAPALAPTPPPAPESGSGAASAPDDLTMLEDNESSFTFSNAAADACLNRVAATQHYPMVPLLARQATFEGTQAWLLVFAWTAEPDPNAPLDRSQTWLVTPEDCRNFSGPELESKVLYRSFSAPA
jgi:hypothetical protein